MKRNFSSVNTILFDDYNQDGTNEILVAGNLFTSEVETPRNDASIGLLLRNTKDGLSPYSLNESGFLVNKDVKNMAEIIINGRKCILVANNDDILQVFEVKNLIFNLPLSILSKLPRNSNPHNSGAYHFLHPYEYCQRNASKENLDSHHSWLGNH